jgi:hypothetical protein
MILCYLYDVPSRKYRNEQYNIENFGVLMCLLSILIFFFFFFSGPFGVPLGLLAHLIKNSPKTARIRLGVRESWQKSKYFTVPPMPTHATFEIW